MEVPDSIFKASKAGKFFFCQVCQGVYSQPKLLPCLHTFCQPCLTSVLPSGQATSITCPLCSHQSSLPAAGVQALPDHLVLSRMCQDYTTQVQGHVGAQSSCTASSTQSTELTSHASSGVRSSHGQAEHSPADQSQQGVQSEATEGLVGARPDSKSQDLHLQALEAIQNLTRLQRKIMSLQEEALRVTYAIEQVNQSMLDWHQQREDVKQVIQQRSVQFQVLIKRKEHQLLSQVDGKQVNDDFYTMSDNCKNELRKILKNILHEVNVLKNVQDHGTYAEINTLSPFVLGKSTGLKAVTLRKSGFNFDIPLETVEETLSKSFGEVELRSQDSSIFLPEILDFTTTSLDSSNEIFLPKENVGRRAHYQRENKNPEMTENSLTLSRSWSDSSTRSKPRPSWHRKCSADHLLQFQSARETLKTQRKQILAHGQQARENALSFWDPFHWQPRYSLTKGKVQRMERTISHDQIFTTTEKTSTLTVMPTGVNVKTCEIQTPLSVSQFETPASPSRSSGPLSRSVIHSCINVPSPVIEEPVFPNTFQSQLFKQTSGAKQTNQKTVCQTEDTQLDLTNKTCSAYLADSRRRSFSPGPFSGHTGRRHSSDQYTINQARTHLESLEDEASNRLLRRANSSAAEKTAKLEFLQDKWQKRKEILIQNEGFLSSTPPARPVLQFQTHPRTQEVAAPLGCQVQSTKSSDQQKLSSTADESVLTSQVGLNRDQAQPDSKLLSSASSPHSADADFSHQTQQELVRVSRKEDALDKSYTAEHSVQMRLNNRIKNQNQEGVNRRHTIEIGGPDIRKAMQIVSHDFSSEEPIAQVTTSSVDFQNTQTQPVSNNKTTGWMEDTTATTTTAGAALVQDLLLQGVRPTLDNSGTTPTNCHLPSTFQTTASVTEQKLKLREITRRKKERWRHLTVH